MRVTVGDRLVVHGRTVGLGDRHCLVTEVHGPHGQPPFMVRWDDGTEALFFPGADTVIEVANGQGARGRGWNGDGAARTGAGRQPATKSAAKSTTSSAAKTGGKAGAKPAGRATRGGTRTR